MMCLVQLSKWRECKAKDAEKLFLSERKLLNEFFLPSNNVRASMHRITFRPSKNTNAVFSATKQMKRMQGQGCWKVLSERKLLNAILE